MSLDADSIDYLQDVKKGKARRFVMICRGVRIMSLVVYKKGSLERHKKQAKEEGRGQIYYGVVDGKGLDITFKLCREDGFDKPPGKELILKDYLFTESGLRFKPNYEVVDVLPEVDERDEIEGTETEGEEQNTASQAPLMPGEDTRTTEELSDECKRLKAVLYPQVKEAVAAHPAQKDAIIRLLASADKNEKAGDFIDAIENYRELSAVLKSLPEAEEKEEEGESTSDLAVLFNERLRALLPNVKAAAGTPAGDEAKRIVGEAGDLARKKNFFQANALLEQADEILNTWAAGAASNEDPTDVFKERLESLLPHVKAAAGTPAGDEAKRIISEAGVFARKKDFNQANTLLEQADEILNNWAAEAAEDPSALFNERLKALLPDVKAAAGTPPGEAGKLKVSEAGVLARKKDFVQANALLDQAEEALRVHGVASDRSSGIAPGLVKKRKFLIERWKQIQLEISASLTALQQALERDVPDEDADLLVELSADYLNDFCDDMKESIDEDINSGDAKYKNAISSIKAFRAQISSDPLIQHLKANPLRADVGLDSVLLNALAEVEQALAS